MPVVTFLNQKGGVGKSSCTHHLSGALSAAGRRVLLVDADPQSSLTQGLLGSAVLDEFDPTTTIAGVLVGADPFPDAVVRPAGPVGVDLVPGSPAANDANVPRPWEQPCAVQTRLRAFLAEIQGQYDLVLIDCPPTLSGCSWAGLVAADGLVVPLQAEDYGAQGVRAIQDWMATVRATTNPGLALLGYLITMFNSRLAIHKAYEARLRAAYGNDVFNTVIPYAADFKEAIAGRQTLSQFKPRGASAKTIKLLAEELLDRLSGTVPSTEAA